MKKVLFSLLFAAMMIPFVANAQGKAGNRETVVTDIAVCGSYTWVDGVTYTTDTTVSYSTADTLFLLNLIVHPTYEYDTAVSVNCGYRVNRNTVYDVDSIYRIQKSTVRYNCDSIINLHLTVVGHTYEADSVVTACEKYRLRGNKFIVNGTNTNVDTTYFESTTATWTIRPTGRTCDSIINFTFNILEVGTAASYDTVSACGVYTFKPHTGGQKKIYVSCDTNEVWNNRTAARCQDSTRFLHINIKRVDTVECLQESCGFVVFDTLTFTSSVYNQIMKVGTNTLGCDSNINLTVIVHDNPVVTITGNWELREGESTTLYAECDRDDVVYLWEWDDQTSTADSIQISNITDNVDVALTATSTTTNCAATTWLTVTSYVGIQGAESANIRLYPNPTVRMMNIESADAIREVSIFNEIGQQVLSNTNLGVRTAMDLSSLSRGTYTVRMALENGAVVTKKVVVTK